ncbi:T27c4.14 protein isoform 1 [Hibiscus syriacus]|uniref:T27c4.14 protein isoform 1 n=1 Tax=Hibiscus syriacus TaxID=106335 RepID=A0A6A3AVK3_HIBSY|nr:T27c4.14 protein isoform 1 [Hibiscus syriacus]
MGYTITLHNSPVEICYFHGVHRRIHSCLPPKVDNGSEREAISLVCRGLQGSACIDTDEFDEDECLSSQDSKASAKRKFKEQINSEKLLNPSTSALDGSFVRNDKETNNDILQNLCSNGKLNDASRLIEIMAHQNQIPHFPSCINLIRGFVKVNELDKANKVLQIMIMSGGIPDNITYNMMVRGLCKKGRIRSANDLLEDMSLSGCPPDVITYNTIIRCMFDNGFFDQAVGFWKDQLRKGCPPYLITYIILIELVCKHCGTARAMEVLHDMAIEGCYTNIVTYNSLVNLTCKLGKYDDAALVIYNIISYGLEPNAVTYNTMIHYEVDEILAIMKETSHPPTVVTYNMLINGLCKYGPLDRAISIFDQIVSRNCSPDIVTYNTLLGALSKEGMNRLNQVEGAIGILKVMAGWEHRVGTSSYKMVVLQLCKVDNLDLAIQVLEMMVSTRSKQEEYATIIRGVVNAGMKQKANKLHQKMKEWEVFRGRKPWS